MSAVLGGIAQAVGSNYLSQQITAFTGLLNIIPKGNIGGIAIQATLEERYTDTLIVTEHPVQIGASITDHSYLRLPEITIKCGWSNSGQGVIAGLGSALTSLGAGNFASQAQSALGVTPTPNTASSIQGGQISTGDYVGGIYSRLIALQQSGSYFDVQTSLRLYHNMVLTSINVTRDVKTSQVLMVQASCRQILVVNVSTAQLPPQASQALPMNTASASDNNVGTVSTEPQIDASGTPVANAVAPNPSPSTAASLPISEWDDDSVLPALQPAPPSGFDLLTGAAGSFR